MGRGGALPGGGLPLQGQRLALGRGQRGLLRGLVVRQRLGGGGAAHGARGLLRAGGRGLPGAVDGARRGLGRLRGAGVQRAAGVHLALRLVLGDIRRPDTVEAAGAAAAGSRRGAGLAAGFLIRLLAGGGVGLDIARGAAVRMIHSALGIAGIQLAWLAHGFLPFGWAF